MAGPSPKHCASAWPAASAPVSRSVPRRCAGATAAARRGVCSHKNRTLTFDPTVHPDLATLRQAVGTALRLTAAELTDGKIKTFSLQGLETWAKMIGNATNKDGWLKVFKGRLLYQA